MEQAQYNSTLHLKTDDFTKYICLRYFAPGC